MASESSSVAPAHPLPISMPEEELGIQLGRPRQQTVLGSVRVRACLFLQENLSAEWTYANSRRRNYSLEVLRKSPTLVLLAACHTYGIWLASCVFLSLACNLFLTWYIAWYQQIPTSPTMSSFPLIPFFAIFLRSWLLVALTGEMVRFCYMLGTEAWSTDPFCGYRRALLGLAGAEM
ncbi:unnamed protein product, partial [Polarella glacialis]